jgi:hypothetical protein
MPYSNVPKEKWEAMDRCVKNVMAKQDVDKERAIAICHSTIVGKPGKSVVLNGVITKAKRQRDGRVKWRARVNSGEFDQEGERFDVSYFDDLVDNFAYTQEAISKCMSFPIERDVGDGESITLPLPITDIAHYSYFVDVRNKARTGYPTKLWVDGSALMAEGYFDDTKLGQLAAKSAMAERDVEKRRMSIGTVPDMGLVEPLDDGRRVLKGGRKRAYIDHLAQTSCPVDTDTEILLLSTEVDMPTQKQDAINVLGDEAEDIVDELEKSKVKSDAASTLLKAETTDAGEPEGDEPEGKKPEGKKPEGKKPGEEPKKEEPKGDEGGEDEDKDEVTEKAEAVVRSAIEGLIKALPVAISKAVEDNLSALNIGDLPDRLSAIETKIKSLAADETDKLKAAIDSNDANWMEELLTKNMSEYSVQHGDSTVVKGESNPGITGKSASTPQADKEFGGLFGNPPESKE